MSCFWKHEMKENQRNDNCVTFCLLWWNLYNSFKLFENILNSWRRGWCSSLVNVIRHYITASERGWGLFAGSCVTSWQYIATQLLQIKTLSMGKPTEAPANQVENLEADKFFRRCILGGEPVNVAPVSSSQLWTVSAKPTTTARTTTATAGSDHPRDQIRPGSQLQLQTRHHGLSSLPDPDQNLYQEVFEFSWLGLRDRTVFLSSLSVCLHPVLYGQLSQGESQPIIWFDRLYPAHLSGGALLSKVRY